MLKELVNKKKLKKEEAKKREEGLWGSLYLEISEIKQVLRSVKKNARQDWFYPMLAMAAYTGARRSELLRCKRR